MKIVKKIVFDMSELKHISTTKQLYLLLGIKEVAPRNINCGLIYINQKQNEDILELIINNAKRNKNLYNVKWRYLKTTLTDEWVKYSPNVDSSLAVPYGEVWLAEGWDEPIYA